MLASSKKKKTNRPKDPGPARPAPDELVSKKAIRGRLGPVETGRLKFFLAGLIGILAAAVYLQTPANGFVGDDPILILQNPQVTGQEPLTNIFSSRFFEARQNKSVYYRPLVVFSYWLEYRLWGNRAAGYHLTNLLIHSLVSMLAFLTLAKWSKNIRLGALAGLIFALHPAHTQSVSWIAGRTDLFCGLFSLGVFYLYLHGRDQGGPAAWKIIPLAALSFTLALLAKELAVVLPALLILSEWFRPGPGKFTERRWLFSFYAMLAAVLAIYFLLRVRVVGLALGYAGQSAHNWYPAGGADFSPLATILKIQGYYLQTLLLPIHLCFESRLTPSASFFDPQIGTGVLAGGFILALVVVGWRRWPEIGFGILWYLIALFPVSNLIPIFELTMEHFLYLPSLGYALALAGALIRLEAGLKAEGAGWPRKIFLTCVIMLLALLAILTVNRNRVWKNDKTVFHDAVSKSLTRMRSNHNLGSAQLAESNPGAAMRSFQRALIGDPGDWADRYNLGKIYFQAGKDAEAWELFEETARLNPGYAKAQDALGICLERKGDWEGAVRQYQKALEIEPGFAAGREHLARAYLMMGQCGNAREAIAKLGDRIPEDIREGWKIKCPE